MTYLKNGQLYTSLNTGQQMPLLGLGCWDMYQREAQQAVAWALEIGYRLIDTAAIYRNETEVGEAIRQSGIPRADIFLTTKLHNGDQGDYDRILKAFDASQLRLNCDYIDLYLIHWPVKHKRADSWKALERLYAEGRVKAIGVSNFLLPFLKEMDNYAHLTPALNQIEFSPYLFLKEELAWCQQRQIQLQGYSPIARGAKFNDKKLIALAEKYGKTPAQIMIRWQLEHDVSVIPKSANQKRLTENFDVFDFQLEATDVALLDGFHENFRVVDDPIDMW